MDTSTAHRMAEDLMTEHELDGWTFAFDRAKTRLGNCRFDKKRITLSKWHTEHNDPTTVRNTILHEIAHAIAGFDAGHGPRWKAVARSIGCDANRCGSSDAPRVYTVEGTCPNCGHTARGYRRNRVACGSCCDTHNDGEFTERYLMQWRKL